MCSQETSRVPPEVWLGGDSVMGKSFLGVISLWPGEGPGRGSAALRSSKLVETRRVGVLVVPSGAVLEGRGSPL